MIRFRHYAAALAACAFVFGAASVATAQLALPYTDDFQTLSPGSAWIASGSTATISNLATSPTTDTWQVVSGTPQQYQNVLTGSGSMKGTAVQQFLGLGPVSSADNFLMSAVLQPVSTAGSANATEGLRFLASSATSVNSSYVADINVGSNPGRLRLVTWNSSGTATIEPSTTQTLQPLIPNFSTSNSYTEQVAGTYNTPAAGDLTLTITVTQVGNSANSVTYTYTDTAPNTGNYFGFFDSYSSGITSLTADYSNLSLKTVATPEPSTVVLLGTGAVVLLASVRRWRRRVA